ncbi:hypothetical protein D3C79_743620 [compost metagenome]
MGQHQRATGQQQRALQQVIDLTQSRQAKQDQRQGGAGAEQPLNVERFALWVRCLDAQPKCGQQQRQGRQRQVGEKYPAPVKPVDNQPTQRR